MVLAKATALRRGSRSDVNGWSVRNDRSRTNTPNDSSELRSPSSIFSAATFAGSRLSGVRRSNTIAVVSRDDWTWTRAVVGATWATAPAGLALTAVTGG